MAVVYATLIIKGVKTIDDVPPRIKDKVVQVLIDLDCGDLAGQAYVNNTQQSIMQKCMVLILCRKEDKQDEY